MKPWMAALLTVLLAGPVSAQSAPGVSVWLQLPKKTDLFAPARAQGAEARILELLGTGAAEETLPANGDRGPLLHFKAAFWSPETSSALRRAELAALSSDWGPALRVEEAAAPSFSGALASPQSMSRAPAMDSALALVPGTLLAGDQAGFYDGFKTASGRLDDPTTVLGRMGSGPPPLTAWTPRIAPSAAATTQPPPPPVLPYADLIEKASRASGIDPALLSAVVAAKSGYRADRVSAGAYGLMGISARNAKAYGYTARQVLDPEINLKVGSDMLADLLREFGGDVHRALAAYQVGPLEVLRSGGIPNDREVRDFMNAVERALGPQARAASIPVKTIRSPLKYAVQKDLIELAEQARKGTGVSRYRPIIERMAARFGVDPKLMESMVMQEDPSGNPHAVSPVGAQGLAQLMPATAAELGISNAFDPVESLRGMARHIRHLSKVFDGDPVMIAASYNAGEGVVRRLGRVPRFRETMAYVRRVFNNYFTLTAKRVDVKPYMPPPRARRRKPAKTVTRPQ